jgi:hypothetical protein
MIKKQAVYIIVVLLLFSTFAYAAPSVTGFSGTTSRNQTVTITGSSFGSGPTVAIYDDFEGGSNGAQISSTATVGTWTEFGDISYSNYSNAAAISGSLAFRATTSTTHYGVYLQKSFTGTGKVFACWWVYLPSGDAFPGADGNRVNWKQMWVQGSSTTDDDIVIPTFASDTGITTYVQNHIFNGNDSGGWSFYAGNISFQKGRWTRFWIYLNGNTSGNDYIDGYFMHNDGGHPTKPYNSTHSWYFPQTVEFFDAGSAYEKIRVNGYGGATNSHPTFDDVYVATGNNCYARVEIGDNATYTSCTKLSILVPTSWSSSSISAKFFPGNFTNGSSAYVFVADSDNSISSGYGPITVGEEESDTEDPVCTITSPTSSATYDNGASSTINIGGTASDNVLVSSVAWACPTCTPTSDSATGTTTWSETGIGLSSGENVITVTATDSSANTGQDIITVTYTPPTPKLSGVGGFVGMGGTQP